MKITMKKIKVFETFAGYGSQAMALKRLPINFEVVGISEIDKYAIQAYNAAHGDTPNFGDISKINWDEVPDFDLFTYSFPCQSISSAGLQKGFEEGSGTTSSLLWECKRAIEAKKPKYLLMENVSALTQAKFMPTFRKWQDYLASLGYSNFAQILNSKDYGVPQNRERVFMVSILGNEWYNFPQPIKLTKCLGDVLESEVDDKYYLSQKMVDCFMRRNEMNKAKGNGFKFEPSDVTKPSKCITTRAGSRADDNYVKQVGNIIEKSNFANPQGGRVYDANGVSPTIDTMQGGGREPKILGYTRDAKGKVSSYHEKDLANTIHTSTGSGGNTDQFVTNNAYIRKLTPKECFRLMGVCEEDVETIIYNTKNINLIHNLKWNAELMDVMKKQKHLDMEHYVLNTINDLLGTEIQKTQLEKELQNFKNVNFAIASLGGTELKGCVQDIIKCTENTEMLHTLIKELGQNTTAIIELEEKRKGRTGRYMKITLEENCSHLKLCIISTLIGLIIKLKIYTYIKAQATMQGCTQITEDFEGNTILRILSLEMVCTYQRLSNSALYKMAGNSIVVDVLEAIFRNLLIPQPRQTLFG